MHMLFILIILVGVLLVAYRQRLGKVYSEMYKDVGYRLHNEVFYIKMTLMGGIFFIVFGGVMLVTAFVY